MNTKTKKIAFIGLMASLAIVLSYVEFLLPPISSAFPGIKIGLPNIAIIFALYRFGTKEAASVSAVRLAVSTLLFGNVMTLAYSLAGATLSLVLMSLLKKIDFLSTVGISVVGGVSHNIGQIAVAVLLLGRLEIAYYLLVLIITGTVAGILIGLAAAFLLKILKRYNF